MNIIYFNLRGVRGITKGLYMRELIRKEGVGMLCLQETNTNLINKEKYTKMQRYRVMWDFDNMV